MQFAYARQAPGTQKPVTRGSHVGYGKRLFSMEIFNILSVIGFVLRQSVFLFIDEIQKELLYAER